MTAEAISPPPQQPLGAERLIAALRQHWPLVLGFAAMAIPTLVTAGRETWSTELGAHGPIVLATGIWLLFQARGAMFADARPASMAIIIPGLLVAVPLYALARALDLLVLEAGAVYIVMLLIAARMIGLRSLIRNFFPFFYLAFLIPLPGWVLDSLTSPLREFVSMVSTGMLHAVGYPIAREGITIYIAQYQMLVEDACSGMNSLVGLTAISLFYIYVLHSASWRHSLALLIAVIPIAILANIIRVVGIILLTYYFGDAVGQGVLHVTTGMVLFAIALMLVFAWDSLLQRFAGRWLNREKAA